MENNTREKFDGYAAAYDSWFMENDRMFESEFRLFRKALGDIKGRKMLSVGCGSGLFESLIKDEGAEIDGLEPSRDMGAIAEKRGVKVVEYGTIENAVLEDEKYDVVYLNGSSTYMEDLELAFGICRKALKKGGRIISLDVPRESAFGCMYLLASKLGSFENPALKGILPACPYPLELCQAGVWHTTEEKIEALKNLGFHDFSFYQTLLANPIYTNDEVEEVVEGYKCGGYVAIIAEK